MAYNLSIISLPPASQINEETVQTLLPSIIDGYGEVIGKRGGPAHLLTDIIHHQFVELPCSNLFRTRKMS